MNYLISLRYLIIWGAELGDCKDSVQHYFVVKTFWWTSFTDYQSYVIHGCLENNPILERSIALFNVVSKWVQLIVLSKSTPQQRADVITKFINIAQELLWLQNFNALMAMVGGLSHSLISCLKETHSCLSSEVTKYWNGMTEPVSSSGNHCGYCKAFADCEGFKIPILGIHLITIHVIFPDWTEDHKVVIVKIHQLPVTLSELVSFLSASHHLEPNMDLINLLPLQENHIIRLKENHSSIQQKPNAYSSFSFFFYLRKRGRLGPVICSLYQCRSSRCL